MGSIRFIDVFLMVLIPFIFVVSIIPLVKKIAQHIGAIDVPNKRKVHKTPMPRLGGLGIYAGVLLGYMIFGEQTTQMNSICMNLIDGLDGLAGGISSIFFLTIGIIAYLQGRTGLTVVITFIMLGSTLGFLVHNFNPAKIFMGDSGSMFLGFIISVITLLGFKS